MNQQVQFLQLLIQELMQELWYLDLHYYLKKDKTNLQEKQIKIQQ